MFALFSISLRNSFHRLFSEKNGERVIPFRSLLLRKDLIFPLDPMAQGIRDDSRDMFDIDLRILQQPCQSLRILLNGGRESIGSTVFNLPAKISCIVTSLFTVFNNPLLPIPFTERQFSKKHSSKSTGIEVQ